MIDCFIISFILWFCLNGQKNNWFLFWVKNYCGFFYKDFSFKISSKIIGPALQMRGFSSDESYLPETLCSI